MFCSDKCRKAFNYLKKTGKVESSEPKPEIPDGTEPDRELMGRVVKVATTSGGKILAHIQFDLEESTGIALFWNKPVKVLFYDYEQPKRRNGILDRQRRKNRVKDPTDDLFDDYDPYID